MTFDPSLLDALEDSVLKDWQGEAWRVVIGKTEPLKTNQRGARWNPPGQEAIYCSLEEKTAIDELENLLAREPVVVRKKRVVNHMMIALGKVAIIRSANELDAFGFSKKALYDGDFTSAQLIGAAINWLDIPGLIVPSARSSAQNIIVFPNCMGARDHVEVLSSYEYSEGTY